jgi:hypothetical protein
MVISRQDHGTCMNPVRFDASLVQNTSRTLIVLRQPRQRAAGSRLSRGCPRIPGVSVAGRAAVPRHPCPSRTPAPGPARPPRFQCGSLQWAIFSVDPERQCRVYDGVGGTVPGDGLDRCPGAPLRALQPSLQDGSEGKRLLMMGSLTIPLEFMTQGNGGAASITVRLLSPSGATMRSACPSRSAWVRCMAGLWTKLCRPSSKGVVWGSRSAHSPRLVTWPRASRSEGFGR